MENILIPQKSFAILKFLFFVINSATAIPDSDYVLLFNRNEELTGLEHLYDETKPEDQRPLNAQNYFAELVPNK